MCINDELSRHPVGDTKTQSIAEIWNGKKMRGLRRVHTEKRGCELLAACKDCYQPRKTVKVPHSFGNRTIYLDDLVGRSQTLGD